MDFIYRRLFSRAVVSLQYILRNTFPMIPIIGIFQSPVSVADQRLARHCQGKILKRCLVHRKRNGDGALIHFGNSLPLIGVIDKRDRNFVCSCVRDRHGRRVICVIGPFSRRNSLFCYPCDLHAIGIEILPRDKILFCSYGKPVFTDGILIADIRREHRNRRLNSGNADIGHIG